MFFIDANFLHGWAMNKKVLPHVETKFDENVELEVNLDTEGGSDIGYTFEVNIYFADAIRGKAKHLPNYHENKISPQVKFVEKRRK